MKQPQDWSAQEKLAAMMEAASLSDEELGVFLRSRGLHEAQLLQWRDLMLSGHEPMTVQRGEKAPESKRVWELEKELRRKDKNLAKRPRCWFSKKSPGDLGGTRTTARIVRTAAGALINEAAASGAKLKPASKVLDLASRTFQRWRGQKVSLDRRCGPLTRPAISIKSVFLARMVRLVIVVMYNKCLFLLAI